MKKKQLINEIEYRQKYDQYIKKQKQSILEQLFSDQVINQLEKYIQLNKQKRNINPNDVAEFIKPNIDNMESKCDNIINNYEFISFEEYLKTIKK